jgi:hypothetical protein
MENSNMTKSFRRRLPVAASCVLAFAGAMHLPAASAATERVQRISAMAVCEAPLPSFDVSLRKRPVGIRNEGGAPIFISCALPADTTAPRGGAVVSVRFALLAGTPAAAVDCSLVAGVPGNLQYTVGTVAVPSGGSAWLTWGGIDKQAAAGSLNFSCNLPPGMDVSTIMYRELDPGDGL